MKKKETKQDKIFNLQEKVIKLIYEEELQDLDFAIAYVKGSLSLIDLTNPTIVEAAEKRIEEMVKTNSLQENKEQV